MPHRAIYCRTPYTKRVTISTTERFGAIVPWPAEPGDAESGAAKMGVVHGVQNYHNAEDRSRLAHCLREVIRVTDYWENPARP